MGNNESEEKGKDEEEIKDDFESRLIIPENMIMSIAIGSMITRIFFIPSISDDEEEGEKKFLMVDTGFHSMFDDILKFIDNNDHGIRRDNISHILVTHSHLDHIGNLSRIQKITKSRIIISDYEAKFAEKGENSDQVLSGIFNKVFMGVVGLFVEKTFQKCEFNRERDILLPVKNLKDEDFRLDEFGVRVVHLPGHTPGSIGVCLEDSKEILVGDLVVEDMSGKKISTPTYCYSVEELKKSYRKIHKMGFERLYPTHYHTFATLNMFENTFEKILDDQK